MSKPRFANKWYQIPPVNELRQEIQNVYTTFLPAIYGAAESTDSDGNPTPNTTDFPPAKYDEGTLFFATSYSDGVGGSMQFQQVAGAWAWRWGSFTGSNENGRYQRGADGIQECWHNITLTFAASTVSNRYDWTFPVTFVDADWKLDAIARGGVTAYTMEFIVNPPSARLAEIWGKIDASDSVNRSVGVGAIGRWKE
jgi:hypothetical protein